MIKLAFCILLFASVKVLAANLPVEHEAMRLMLAVESSVNDEEWGKASQQLNALSLLDITPPDNFFYFNGLVNLKLNQLPESEKNLESYIIKEGSEGKYYVEALKLITEIDHQQASSPPPETTEAKSSSISSSEGRTGYIKSLQALYLTDDPVKALVMQINSLLSVHAYTGLRVKKANARSGVIYSVSANGGQLGLQEKNFDSGFPTLTATKLGVHGLDPFLKYQCKNQAAFCAIYHPADAHQIWIKIENDELVVRELTEALTKLIQYMQLF